MHVRPATAADIAAMIALEREAATAAHWTAAEYERIFTPGQTPRVALVSEKGGKVRGFLVARVLGPDWEIENIAVGGQARRQGVGASLVGALLDVARSRGADAIYLEVRESNHAARALYEKVAFVRAGERKAYYYDPVEDALLYQLRFAP